MIVGSDVVSQAAQQLPLPDAMELLKVYLREHLADQIRIKHLASLVALSPYYFVRTFTRHVGVPPHRYLLQMRMERARELLERSDLSATQICHRVGFTTLSHFTNTFRQHVGMSPTAYRRARMQPGADWRPRQDPATVRQELASRAGRTFA
ncbi:MAG TPA: AraC family transcriptional regulator [Actinomycetota bacterium]|nr:AraC family transcriptional regulator [Actinomycetota bacterium]